MRIANSQALLAGYDFSWDKTLSRNPENEAEAILMGANSLMTHLLTGAYDLETMPTTKAVNGRASSHLGCEKTLCWKDTGFHIIIRPAHSKDLRFCTAEALYQYKNIPFGLSVSSRA